MPRCAPPPPFAATGAPGTAGGSRPPWPAFGPEHSYLVLDTAAAGGIRAARGLDTRETVLESIARDPRLADPRVRCLVYRDLVIGSPALTRQTYDSRCQGFPFEGYPWRK